ncbi:hypothetical protein TWF730_007282 [Orbilia blumenaviensis]|uniref:O-acyltransferase WSD1 C-terminal domain-containing protein n=1 Tax=Orbilia blumenaviensis TaxID=1796055 RepID=A0AAV9VDR6_9PEZI
MENTESHPLAWRSPSPLHYQRPFDPIEKYEYYMVTLNPSLPQRAVVVGVTFSSSTSVSIQSLKSAWRCLRYAHPILGCDITPAGFDFRMQSPSQIDEWVDSTFKILNDDEKGVEEQVEAIENRKKKTIKQISANCPCPKTAECYYSPSTNSLFFQLRHELTDGIGSFMLINNFLTHLLSSQSSSPQTIETLQTENPTLLSPSMSEIAKTTEASDQLIARINLIVKKYLSSTPIGLPLKPTLTDFESTRQDHTFTTSQTTSLLSACKSHNITITTAFTASIGLTILKLTGAQSGDFTTSLPTSLRDTFPAPYNTAAHAALFAVTSPMPVMPITTSTPFVSLANTVKAAYNDWKEDKENIISHTPQGKIFQQFVEAGVIAQNSFSGKATVVLSSLGIVEKYLTVAADSQKDGQEMGEGRIGIDDFWVGQVQGNTKIILFLYTFRSKLRLAACYNRRFHEDEFVKQFTSTLIDGVYTGLGISR